MKRKSNLVEKMESESAIHTEAKAECLWQSSVITAIVNFEQYINICFIDRLGLSLYLTSKPNNSTMVRFSFLYIYLQVYSSKQGQVRLRWMTSYTISATEIWVVKCVSSGK